VKSLFDSQVATREQLEDATTAADVARAQLRAAAFNRAHAVISAPGDGRVLHRLVEPDELVGPGQPVLVLGGDATSWVLRVGIPDRDVVRISEGIAVQVDLSAWPGAAFSGTVREIASAATPVGTYEIDVGFVAPGKTLRAGLIGRIRIEAPAEREMNLVPATALRDGDGDGATVWSANADGSVTSHAVKVGFFTGELVALSSGLDGVSAVVTDGAAYLSAHSRVEVMPAARPAAANPRGTP
jgi:RND family efflux transporter MFP subunit